MNQSDTNTANNPLGTEPVGRLLWKFSIPFIIALLVSSFYNIVDQFFIGRNVGELGNAATNIAFPLTITCSATSLFFGMGGAAAFNLAMGKGEKDKAVGYLGNAASMLFLCGAVLCIVTVLFLEPMLKFFGSPDEVLEYAKTYTGIVSIGLPFLALTGGGGHLIRADGRPRASMFCNLSRAIINIFLDALFVSVLHYGMAGAAAATIIGQVISGSLAIRFLADCQTVKLKKENLILKKEYIERVASLGTFGYYRFLFFYKQIINTFIIAVKCLFIYSCSFGQFFNRYFSIFLFNKHFFKSFIYCSNCFLNSQIFLSR